MLANVKLYPSYSEILDISFPNHPTDLPSTLTIEQSLAEIISVVIYSEKSLGHTESFVLTKALSELAMMPPIFRFLSNGPEYMEQEASLSKLSAVKQSFAVSCCFKCHEGHLTMSPTRLTLSQTSCQIHCSRVPTHSQSATFYCPPSPTVFNI